MSPPAVLMAPPLGKNELLTFSKRDWIRRAQALSCTLPEKNKLGCTATAFLGLFFDGTGNNRDDDLPKDKHSNIVRLWMAHRDSRNEALGASAYWRPEYIPGVGTPFPQIGETKYQDWRALVSKAGFAAGGAAALGGQARIFWALLQTLNAMHRAIKGRPLVPDAVAGPLAALWGQAPSLGKSQLKSKVKELAAILKNTPKPELLKFTVSVFGFSRGAAQARAFCNDFYELLCEPAGAGHTLAGVPVNIIFLGLFDTVASVGLVGADILTMEGHQAWANKALRVHPAIRRCVHYVAAHEVRACFPLDSVRYKGALPGNCVEVVYPGTHSDVGGGYAPNAQGRSPLPGAGAYSFLALVPCIHMYREAYMAGVPLVPFANLPMDIQKNFVPTDQLLEDFNAYAGACKASGSVEEVLARCMAQYRHYRYRRLGSFIPAALAQGCPAEDAKFLKLINGYFQTQCKEFQRKYANAKRQADHDHRNDWAQKLAGGPVNHAPSMRDNLNKSFFKEDLDLWEAMHRVGEMPSALTVLFDKYVHDSMAGFAQQNVDEFFFNGRGLMRNRTVYDQGGE